MLKSIREIEATRDVSFVSHLFGEDEDGKLMIRSEEKVTLVTGVCILKTGDTKL